MFTNFNRNVRLFKELWLFCKFYSYAATSDTASVRGKQPNKPMKAEDYQRIESDLQERFLQQQRQEDILRRQSWGLHGDEEDILEPVMGDSIGGFWCYGDIINAKDVYTKYNINATYKLQNHGDEKLSFWLYYQIQTII